MVIEIGNDPSEIDWEVSLNNIVLYRSQLVPKGKEISRANGNMTCSSTNSTMVLEANLVARGPKICGRS
jgi:hypothetical protein